MEMEYELVDDRKELGQGSEGFVRVCRNRSTGQELACKTVCFLGGAAGLRKASRARSEIAALAALQGHPNIVRMEAHYEGISSIKIVLELCLGGDLFDLLLRQQAHLISRMELARSICSRMELIRSINSTSRGFLQPHLLGACSSDLCSSGSSFSCTSRLMRLMCGFSTAPGSPPLCPNSWPLLEAEAAEIFTAVLHAIAYCHHCGIVHRDIKLDNLLLPAGSSGCSSYGDVKLADFGSAAEFRDNVTGESKAIQGMMGTLSYMAPEMLACRQYDERVDVWSLGVLLYVLLCGCFPYKGDDPHSILHNINNTDFEDLGKGNIAWLHLVSSPAKNLVEKLLQRDPMKRSSLKDLLDHPWLIMHGLAKPFMMSKPSGLITSFGSQKN